MPGLTADFRERAEGIHWYHTLELAPGYTTRGMFDLRDQVGHYGVPERLDGMRVLEIGSLNGFWAFELERRGADEVIAIDVDDERDLDWPPRRRHEIGAPRRQEGLRLGSGREGFLLAKEAFDSGVERRSLSVYDARPAELGTFDLIFCGSVIMHLRDQMLALERIADLCHGTFISAEEYDRAANLVPFPVSRFYADRMSAVVFWLPSIKSWQRMLHTAGFDRVRRHARFKLRSTEGWSVRHVVFHASKP